jgi:hypothetical protein
MRGKRNSGETKFKIRNSGDTIPIQENWVMSPNFEREVS